LFGIQSYDFLIGDLVMIVAPKMSDYPTMSAPIYRSLEETLNKTTFELYVRESYHPVIHGYYLQHPEVAMINAVVNEEENNICYTRLPIINIIDLLVNGHYFAWKNPEDVTKVRTFLKAYVDQFKGVKFDKENKDMESFLSDCKFALDQLDMKIRDQKERVPTPKKRRTIKELLGILGGNAL
jgi:hypothetical protein